MADEPAAGPPSGAVTQASVASGAAQTIGDGPAPVDRDAEAGGRIGRYVVLEQIGAGGMGVVVRAWDPRLQRQVALKRVRGRPDSTDEARLLREAHAMARLTHPNVVVVHDVETHAGSVVVAMEYVQGRTLRAWLEETARGWKEITEVFLDAGRGLVAAHEAGLLHRDFKPANVFVGDDGRVRVGDFGLARPGPMSLSGSSTDAIDDPTSPTLTVHGVAIGTPRYMAPEQHHGDALDAAVDQFAFCVALREALVGKPPYEARDLAGLAKAKDSGPPAWPSPHEPPDVLVQAIQRGLAARSTDRWPTMRALLDALRGSLRPKSSRRWGVVGFAGLAVAGVAVASLHEEPGPCTEGEVHLRGSWPARADEIDAALRASGQPYADATVAEVRRRLDAFAGDWRAAYVDACEATHVRGERSSERLDRTMACLHDARRTLESSLDVLARDDREVVEHAVEVVAELPLLSRCDNPSDDGVPPPGSEDAAAYAEVESGLSRAAILRRAALHEQAVAELDDGCRRPVASRYEVLGIRCQYSYGLLRLAVDDNEGARARLSEALDRALVAGDMRWASRVAASLGPQMARTPEQRPVARWLGRLAKQTAAGLEADARERSLAAFAAARVVVIGGDSESAVADARAALAELRRVAPDDPALPLMAATVGGVLSDAGRLDEAETILREAIDERAAAVGEDHPTVAAMYSNLGGVLLKRRQTDAAEVALRRSLEIRRAVYPAEHSRVVASLVNLANVLNLSDRADEAEPLAREALGILDRTDWDSGARRIEVLSTLGTTLRKRGRPQEAAAYQREAVAFGELVYGIEHPKVATLVMNLAVAVNETDPATARVLLERSAFLVGKLDRPAPSSVKIHANLGRYCRWARDWDCADRALATARDQAVGIFGVAHPDVAEIDVTLGDVARERGQLERAATLYDRAAANTGLARALPVHRAQLRAGQARLAWAHEANDESRAALLAAHRQLVTAGSNEGLEDLEGFVETQGIELPSN